MRPFDAQPTSPSETPEMGAPVAPRRPGLSLCPCRGFKCGSAAGSRAALERDLDCAHSTLLRIRHPRPTPPAVRRARPRVLRGLGCRVRVARLSRVLLELTWAAEQHIYIYYTSLGHGARTHNLETCRLILRPARGAQGPGRRRWPVGAGPLSACGLRATEAGPATRTLRNSRTIDMMAECTTQVTASMRERTSIPHHSTRSPLTKAPS